MDGNQLVVKGPEGTREMTVPQDFRFTVDGKLLTVKQLKPGMAGTATISTKTTVMPVTVTKVKNGTVLQAMGTASSCAPRGFKTFTQSDIDKRGIRILRAGKPAGVSDFRAGDKLSAVIITSMPPKVVTEQEVNATLAASGGAGAGGAAGGAAAAPRSGASPSGASTAGAGAGAPASAARDHRERRHGVRQALTAEDRQPASRDGTAGRSVAPRGRRPHDAPPSPESRCKLSPHRPRPAHDGARPGDRLARPPRVLSMRTSVRHGVRIVTVVLALFPGLAIAQERTQQPSTFGATYEQLSPEQRALLVTFFRRAGAVLGVTFDPRERYDAAPLSSRTTFDAVTHALLRSTLTDRQSGQPLGRTIDIIGFVEGVRGQVKGASGDQQFRIYVTLGAGARERIDKAKEFRRTADNAFFHQGYPISYRQEGYPSVQVSITEDGSRADIDVDYRSSRFPVALVNGHLSAANSTYAPISIGTPGSGRAWSTGGTAFSD